MIKKKKKTYVAHTVDGHNPAPLETIVGWYLRGESSFQGFVGGAGFRPSPTRKTQLELLESPCPRKSRVMQPYNVA